MIPIQNPPTQASVYLATQDDTSPLWIRWFESLGNAFNNLQATGTTSQRPNPAPWIGFPYFDTTINKPVWAKTISPTAWVYADGTAA